MLAALVLSTGPAAAQRPAPQQIAVPQAEVLLVLIRTAIAALDHANKTGNYSVLRELGGPGLQASSSGQLSGLFAALRNGNIDLSPALVITPQLNEPPAIGSQGLLQLTGLFATTPHQIGFQIVYQPVAGQWRLYGLSVTLQQVARATAAPAAGGVVPTPPAAPAPAAAVPDKKPEARPSRQK